MIKTICVRAKIIYAYTRLKINYRTTGFALEQKYTYVHHKEQFSKLVIFALEQKLYMRTPDPTLRPSFPKFALEQKLYMRTPKARDELMRQQFTLE